MEGWGLGGGVGLTLASFVVVAERTFMYFADRKMK